MSRCRFIAGHDHVERLRRGEDFDQIICGAPCREGSPYCAEHHRRCGQQPSARKGGGHDIAGSFSEARQQQIAHRTAAE